MGQTHCLRSALPPKIFKNHLLLIYIAPDFNFVKRQKRGETTRLPTGGDGNGDIPKSLQDRGSKTPPLSASFGEGAKKCN